MIKALLLIFSPVPAWERIVRAQRSFAFVLTIYLLPMLILAGAAEGYGLIRWGKLQRDVEFVKKFSAGEAVVYEIGQLLLGLGTVLLAAKIIKSLGETFHGRHTYTQTFTVVAYGISPFFLLRLMDAFPVNPWISWSIGILLSMAVLYQGVPRVMQPDPPHAFGLYLASVLLLVIITGLARFVTAWYLQGRFTGVESVIHNIGSRLPI